MMFDILIEDFRLNSFRSFIILFFYRLMHEQYTKKRYFFLKILNISFYFVKFFLSLQSQISYKAKIGRGVRLPHIGFGVVISSKAIIGNNVTIYHLVTIGINEKKCKKDNDICVRIGNNCYISAGAKIISSNVSNNVIIGPNAVLFNDIKSGSLVLNMTDTR